MTTFEVQLAVYDLSRGMARSLSAQFLGPQHALDYIPHTGLVVFGKEYFYGGGIQSATPNEFRRSMGIFPIQTQSLGRTSVSQQEFETWCANMMRNGRYSAEAYDLLNRNCNNFCHDAALEGLRLSQGVPEEILNVPRRFLASPMGQMVRLMLENMQITGRGGGAPFATAAPPVTTNTTPASSNPWANMPSSAAAPSATTNAAPAKEVSQQGTPVLDSFKRPLLSNDTKTAAVCAKKLIATATNDDDDKAALEKIGSSIDDPTPDDVEAGSKAILQQLQDKQNVTFALMLLRLVVLHPGNTTDDDSHVVSCLKWVQSELTSEHNGNSALTTAAARSMAWCVLSNVLGAKSSDSSCETIVLTDSTVEAALADIVPDSQPRVEVRQAAAAYLYNVALLESKKLQMNEEEELPDRVVSLLCASLDGVAYDETDTTTQLRRILVAARLVKPVESVIQPAAKTLVQDLGFADGLEPLTNGSLVDKKKASTEQLYKLSKEFVSMINS